MSKGSDDGKITAFRRREWFTYDRKAQESLTNYSKVLIESSLQWEGMQIGEPECHCVIGVPNSYCHTGAEFFYSLRTTDAESLRRLVGALEEVKQRALVKLVELADQED